MLGVGFCGVRVRGSFLAEVHKCGENLDSEVFYAYTGNTRWGVQNLDYDPAKNVYMMCVYTGKKEQFPNYPMFLIDASKSPEYKALIGREGEFGNVFALAEGNVRDEKTGVCGTNYSYGSTGIASLGADENGVSYYYVSYDGNGEDGNYANVRLCRSDDENYIVPIE